MDSAKVCMIAVTGVCTAMILKQWKSDLLPLFRLAVRLVLAVGILSAAAPLVSALRELGASSALAPYVPVLLKALGVAVLTQGAAGICRECGESGMADAVEFAGKAEILLLSLPLMQELFAAARELLELGGAA